MSAKQDCSIRIILNGKAAADPQLREAVSIMRERGFSIEIRVTWEFGDAARFSNEAVEEGIDIVVAAGGDGTVNEVVTGMLQSEESTETRLGILPFGTANDLASGCGIPVGDPLAALELVTKLKPTKIDVGEVNRKYFVNVASAGFGAEVTARTPPEMKRVFGGAAYSLMGLVMALKMTDWKTRVTIGEQQSEGDMVVLAVGNGRQAGGGYEVTPHAELDDGLLDLMVVHDIEVPQFGVLLNELNDLQNPENRFVSYRQLSSFVVETEEEIQLNLDGEPIQDHRFEFSVVPQRIPLLIPARGQHLERGEA